MAVLTGFIYKITNKLDGKIYVGQTTQTLARRWQDHINGNGHSRYLYNAIKRHGSVHFSMEQLEVFEANSKTGLRQLLNKAEPKHIEALSSMIPNGYNVTSGGAQPQISPESVLLRAEKHKKPIRCNETGQEWPSVADCALYFGIKPKQISRVLKGQRKRLKWKYTFSYLRQS